MSLDEDFDDGYVDVDYDEVMPKSAGIMVSNLNI